MYMIGTVAKPLQSQTILHFNTLFHSGLLPVRGSIPDMTSDSERYIQLQNVYREQAAQDIAAVTQHLHNILQGFGKVNS